MIRLLELRSEKGLTQRELAKEMNISQGTYNNWENGNTQPSLEQLISLSKFFEVSIDYLIGVSAEYNSVEEFEIPSRREKELLKKFKNLSVKEQDGVLVILDLLNEK